MITTGAGCVLERSVDARSRSSAGTRGGEDDRVLEIRSTGYQEYWNLYLTWLTVTLQMYYTCHIYGVKGHIRRCDRNI
jgi:hypothetical protein